MDDPRRGDPDELGRYADEYEDEYWPAFRKPNRSRGPAKRKCESNPRSNGRGRSKESRVESRDGTFRCRHCKTLVGVPISGGRHRNHCPLCLYSRHVDKKRPGDRAETCRSMMMPIGVYARPSGEQVLVHECLGCGIERHNRVAADDNVIAVMRLRVLDPAVTNQSVDRDERPA